MHATCPTTRDDLAGLAAALDPAGEHLLELIARLPLASLGILAPFLNARMGTAHRQARRLCQRGLLAAIASPVRTGGRPARLFLATDLGLAVLARRRATEPAALAGLLGLDRSAPTRLLRELPSLLATYELLALLAARGSGPASLQAWEHPWRRPLPPRARPAGSARRVVRLPAAATLAWLGSAGVIPGHYLLLPDTGGLALPVLRATLGRLAEHQAATATPATLVIATSTARRAGAWAALLEAVCQARALRFWRPAWRPGPTCVRRGGQRGGAIPRPA